MVPTRLILCESGLGSGCVSANRVFAAASPETDIRFDCWRCRITMSFSTSRVFVKTGSTPAEAKFSVKVPAK